MKMRQMFKLLAGFLAVLMIISVLPVSAFAVINYDESVGSSYYNVISKKDWDLAPGIQETEIVLNNDAGARRQVLHTVTVDLNNPYTKVIPGTKGMWPQAGNYGTEGTFIQASNAEKLGYGNVVAATNCSLSWYTEAYYKDHPELIGEPLGYSILDGKMYANSRFEEGKNGGGVKTIIVINYDNHPITGEPRPADMPKTWIRRATDPLTGWEEQAIPVLFDYLVKPDANGNPVNQYSKENHTSDIASRTFVGVKADGTLVVAVSDGEQAPYSVGFTPYEMADYMIKMGCVIAANCDGGGSTTFVSQRPGEDLKINCSLADGGERPTSNTIIIISTAPADGVFAQASVTSEFDFYAPGATVTFNAMGTDAVGTKVDIPADVTWTIKEPGMGTIENGVFTSNGTQGTVTAQMIYDGQVVGERTITIAAPEEIFFDQPVVTIPYGKTAKIPVKASIGGGLYEIGLGDGDITFTTTNAALGTFNGLSFTAVTEALAPADTTSIVTATLNSNPSLTATVQLNLGKGSEILWDFEDGQADIDEWFVINNRKNAAHWDYDLKLSLADRTNGQVHDGNYSMRLETNGLSSKDSHSEQYAWIRMGVDGEALTLKNARSVGFWLYVPEDNIQCWVQGHYMYDSDGNGTLDSEATVSMMESENVYYNIDESGWHYLSMDISAFKEVALRMSKKYDIDPSDGMKGATGEVFLALVFHKAINNKLWQENGSINGNYTYYLDNFTVDYSDVVDDRENPVFDKIYLDGTTALVKRDVVTTTSNVLNLSAAVADATTKKDADKNVIPLYTVSGLNADTAKVYVDGVEVNCTFDGTKIVANGIEVADGYHRVKFEICDNVGNKSVIIRVVKVESGVKLPTINVVPADPTLDRILFGSVYWMNLEATNIDTIQTVETVIDLNNVNHWELDHMIVADGFSATYTIAEETNTATITFTRVDGFVPQTGAATLAQLPVRMLYFDTDIKTPGYTAQTYWTTYAFWAQDLKMDVDKGLIIYTDGKTSTFSNEEFHVDSEMYTSMGNMDKVYFAEHGTTHVHTPAAIADKAATCSEDGYTGRTFCAVCNSVVDWGTTIPATGHAYKADLASKTVSCACGATHRGTGHVKVENKYYYTTAGVLTSGWLTIDDEWYYFDKTTFSNVSTFNNGYVTYKFHEDGRLVSGEWHKSAAGIRYYEGPSYLRGGKSVMTWYTIDGKDYCMDRNGYVAVGTRWVNDLNGTETYTWYTFDENGVCQGKWNYTGLAEWNGNLYYVKDGVNQVGMYYVDGAYYYFYWTNYRAAIKGQRFSCPYTQHNHGLVPAGSYYFGADGKMLNETVYNLNGTLYYFVLGNESQGNGVFTYNGQNYAIDANGKVHFTGIIKDADGKYQYYVDGVQSGTHAWDQGVITTPAACGQAGVVTYTCSDCEMTVTMTIAALSHTDSNNDYVCDLCNGAMPHTHAWDNGKITTPATCVTEGVKTYTCACGETKTEAIAAPGHLDENGDLACDFCGTAQAAKNGLVFDADGNIRYYKNGVAQRAGLVRDSQGNYYYINSSLQAVKNKSYSVGASMTNGLLPAGTYKFDATGKMIDPPAGEPIHIHAWGEGVVTTPATCGHDGVLTYVCECGFGKTEVIPALNHVDANGDFTCDNCDDILPHEHVWGEGVVTTPADCENEGVKTHTCPCGETKTVPVPALGHIDDNDDCQCDRCGAAVAHVHKWDNGVITTPADCENDGVKTYTCPCGETKTEVIASTGHANANGDFACDNCGTILPHDHIWDNGMITTPATCVTEGVKTYTCACGETKTEAIAAPGHLDENGDLACDFCGTAQAAKNGLVFDADGNIRYYKNGVAQRAGLVRDSQGNYYYINSSLQAVKNKSYSVGASMTNGLLPAGTYKFDATGKMIDPPAGEPIHIHAWGEGVVTTPATCGHDGVLTYVCECGFGKTEVIPALNHVDANGDFTCDNCDDILPHEHVWGEGVVTTPADCENEGVKTHTCPCGETKTVPVPALGHIDDNDDCQCDRCGAAVAHVHKWDNGVITTPADCENDGVKTYTCPCGETKTEVIASTGHANANGDFACDNCGTILPHDHIWDNGVEIVPTTCTQEGFMSYACACGETKIEIIPSFSHKDENGDLSCDYGCGTIYTSKNGLVFEADGSVRYYKDGVAQRAGLVQDSEGNYYYINSSCKAVVNCTYSFSAAMSNGLLPAGTYKFDATGKLILE